MRFAIVRDREAVHPVRAADVPVRGLGVARERGEFVHQRGDVREP